MKTKRSNKASGAVACFHKGFSCSQAVLSTYGPAYGLSRKFGLKIGGAFGAGMGRMGETCGAVTGAFMVIGLKFGKTRTEDEKSKEKVYALVKEFVKRFRKIHGSIICRDLLGCDLGTPEGFRYAKKHHLISTRCPEFVHDTCEILDSLFRSKR